MSGTARIAAFVILGVAGLVALGSIYTVSEVEQMIITQFGKPVGAPITSAGLKFKLPFVQEVNPIDKRVLEWDEGKKLTIEMVDSNMPMKAFIAEFALRPDSMGTIVTMTPKYTPSYGIMGLIGDAMFGKRQFKGMLRSVLADLKSYSESRGTEAQAA